MKTASELVEYIDHVLQSLNADYGMIYDTTRIVRDNVPEAVRNRLDWQLAHMHKDLVGLTNNLKQHQEALLKGINGVQNK